MMTFLLIVHVVVCFVLIFVVLLQAGRGGGFSEMVGGGQPQSIFGTQTNTFMTRATEVSAALFIITSLSLGILTSQKSKSLVEKAMESGAVNVSGPVIPAAKTVIPETPIQAPTASPVASESSQVAEAVATTPVAETSKTVEAVAEKASKAVSTPVESQIR